MDKDLRIDRVCVRGEMLNSAPQQIDVKYVRTDQAKKLVL
jgi:hypothetical protein